MSKSIALTLVLALLVIGCGQKNDKVGLTEGTPAYQLAKELSAVLPAVDPAINKVVASAKDFDITTGEVIQALQDNAGNRTAQLKTFDAGQLKTILEQGINQIADKKILINAAAKKNIVVTPEELDNALKAEYGRAGGEQNYLDAIKQNGLSFEHVKKSIQEGLAVNKYVESHIASSIQVSSEEIQQAYQEDKTASVRHILLLTQGKNDQEKAEILKKMEEILAKAKSGEDFAGLAKQYSEDPGSKENGGLYEDFGHGKMVKPFEEAAFSVPVGEISGIVETNYGYHILKIVNRKKETKPLEEVRGELEKQIKKGKLQTAMQSHLAELRKDAGLQIIGL